jgi:predicted transcriptional regulator
VPRSRAEIEADLERLQSELADTDESANEVVEEISEVIEEAVEVHDDAIEEAAQEVVDEVTETIEDAAEEATDESPLTDNEDIVEDEVASKVIEILAKRYNLHPIIQEEVVAEPETIAPVGEHFKYRRIW